MSISVDLYEGQTTAADVVNALKKEIAKTYRLCSNDSTAEEIKTKLREAVETENSGISPLEKRQLRQLLSDADKIPDDLNAKGLIREDSAGKAVSFVGVLLFRNFILKFYPKVYDSESKADMRTVFQAMRKYKVENPGKKGIKDDAVSRISDMEMENIESRSNYLYNCIALLQDYFENGIYINSHENLVAQGNGEIDWDATVNGTLPFIQKGKPYYVNYFAWETEYDDSDYISRLHQCLLTHISCELEEVLEFIGVETTNLYEGELSDFGEVEYIINRLRQELNVQFITRKQILLKRMIAVIEKLSDFSENGNDLYPYGTRDFEVIWETACKKVFGDQLDSPLVSLELQNYSAKSSTDIKLKDLMPKPKWSRFIDVDASTGQRQVREAERDTLTPDFISVIAYDNRRCFTILDAKYYNFDINESNSFAGGNPPGVGDINKQYLYQLAYRDLIQKEGFDVLNAFLVPSDDTKQEGFRLWGEVVMPIFTGLPFLCKSVQVIRCPVKTMMECYCRNARLEIFEEVEKLKDCINPFDEEDYKIFSTASNEQ